MEEEEEPTQQTTDWEQPKEDVTIEFNKKNARQYLTAVMIGLIIITIVLLLIKLKVI